VVLQGCGASLCAPGVLLPSSSPLLDITGTVSPVPAAAALRGGQAAGQHPLGVKSFPSGFQGSLETGLLGHHFPTLRLRVSPGILEVPLISHNAVPSLFSRNPVTLVHCSVSVSSVSLHAVTVELQTILPFFLHIQEARRILQPIE